MATERLQVILELVTGQYKREAREVAKATQQVDSAAKGADKSTGSLKSRLDANASSMKALAGGAAIGAAVVGLGKLKDFADGAIDSYSDLNESLNAVNVSFGENAQGIQALGRASATNLGIANAEFNSLAVSMSAFVEAIAGEGGDVVGTMDELTTRASDFASVMNLEVEDAFEKFRSGLAGESEPLRKFGIDISAARVEAFALANGISEAGDEMTEAEKIQARYGLIMEQTADTAGDFANTSDELANQTRITNARLENQRAIVGETLQVYREWGNSLSLISGTLLADLALGIQMLNGNISEGEFALRRYEVRTGEVIVTMQDLVDLVGDTNRRAGEIGFFQDLFDDTKESADRLTRDLPALVEGLDLTTDELLEAIDMADSFAHQMGLTAEETEAFKAALRELLNDSLNETRENFGRAGGAAGRWRDAQREATEETLTFAEGLDLAAEAQRGLITAMLEAIDPAIRAAESLKRMEDAQTTLEEVQADGEATAGDVARAQLDYAEAVLEAQAALDVFDASDPEDSIRALADALRISNDDARAILDTLNLLDGKVVDVTIRTSEIIGNQGPTGRTTSIGGRQHGGPIESLRPYVVGEAGPEVIIPQQSGFVVNNNDVQRMIRALESGGGRGGGDINIGPFVGSDTTTDIGTGAAIAGIMRRVEGARR